MRIGVLDVGSNAAQLLVADLGEGVPLPVRAVKTKLRLAERIGPDRRLDRGAVVRMANAVSRAAAQAREMGVQELFGYATAIVRDAPNRDEALSAVRQRSGVRLAILSGVEEAELTFLAARRWMGWRAGPLLLLDVGGGTAEVAYGHDMTPANAVSLPLGAGRLTREWLRGDPPGRRQVRELRDHLRAEFAGIAGRLRRTDPCTGVGTSRTLHQLARLCGAAPQQRGPYVPRVLHREDLGAQLPRLAQLTAAERARLPGISRPRARQSLAGALVAHAAMEALGLSEVTICPWALREGVLLRRLEYPSWWHVRKLALDGCPPRPAASERGMPKARVAGTAPLPAARRH